MKETPCITASTEQVNSSSDDSGKEEPQSNPRAESKKEEPQSHPRAGTPELANGSAAKSTNEKKPGSPILANEREDSKKNESYEILEHPGIRKETEREMFETSENNTRETKIIIVNADSTALANQNKANAANEKKPGSPELANQNKANATNEKKPGSPELAFEMKETETREPDEHPGTKQEGKSKKLEISHTREPVSEKGKAVHDVDGAKTDKEDKKANQKTSKSCILI